MLKLFLWLRNLRRKKIVLLSVLAVALASGLLIVVASIFHSFISAVETSATKVLGDVMIRPAVRFAQYDRLINGLEELSEVRHATAVLQSSGLIHLGPGNVRAVSVWGIDPQGRAKVMDFEAALLNTKNLQSITSADSQTPGIFVGIGVVAQPDPITDEYDFNAAKNLIGSRVVITTGSGAGISASQKIRARTIPFEVADIVFTGVYELDSKFVYVPIDILNQKLYPGAPLSADMVQIKLPPGQKGPDAVTAIRAAFEQFAQEELGWGSYLISQTQVETAQEVQRKYIAELRKQMAMLLIIFGAASLGAILLIFCIFYMIVVSKQRDIAILKASGASSGSVAWTFVAYGITIGLIGSLLGLVIGYYFLLNIDAVEQFVARISGLKIWKSSVYLFSTIPNDLHVPSAIWIMFAAIAASAVGALIPAFAAARVRPVRILRYE